MSSAHRHLHSFPTRRSSDLRCPFQEGKPEERDGSEGVEFSLYSSAMDAALGTGSAFRPVQQSRLLIIKPSPPHTDRKSTRLNSSHVEISYAVFCLKKKKKIN